jgi:Flp pilus assembly protein TadB
MDSRGFGRQEPGGLAKTRTTRMLSIAALLLLTIGTFTLLSSDLLLLSIVSLILGLVILILSFRSRSAKQLRTFYRPEKPELKDAVALLIVIGALVGVSLF